MLCVLVSLLLLCLSRRLWFVLRLDAPAVAVYETVRLLRLCSLLRSDYFGSVPSFRLFVSCWYHTTSVLFLLVVSVPRFGSISVRDLLLFLIPLSSFLFLSIPLCLVLILVAGNLCYIGLHPGPLRLRSRCMRPYGCCVFGEKNYNYRFDGLCSICSRNRIQQLP